MNVTRFWWLRHGVVDGPRGCIHGPDAPILKPEAWQISGLKRLLPAQALWLTSPAERARQTVKSLTHTRPMPQPALMEQDFGNWTGRTHRDLEAEDPQGHRAFWQDAASNIPPGGESFANQCQRVAANVDALATEHVGIDLIAVAHSGTIRAALVHALGLAPAAGLSFVIDPLSLTRLDLTPGGWRVVCVNVTVQLPGL
ncbi:histidine phosphatase family protein [Lacibacterium aquatile]|uniref:Histidine phosphatase family protein n=1 Tax=Lacibacterium aquatile TaxID=1168082 RepID=A0ABW5DW99_9PROT